MDQYLQELRRKLQQNPADVNSLHLYIRALERIIGGNGNFSESLTEIEFPYDPRTDIGSITEKLAMLRTLLYPAVNKITAPPQLDDIRVHYGVPFRRLPNLPHTQVSLRWTNALKLSVPIDAMEVRC